MRLFETLSIMTIERIYLVGFMGAGKSTLGRELALKLGWTFVDMDAEIEKAAGSPVREIFERSGEQSFRKLEQEHLKHLSVLTRAVIALGGGAYVDEENRRLVDSTGVAVWLQASLSTITDRVRPDGTRPLFSNPQQVRNLYESRLGSYRLARIHVRTDNLLPDEIADDIVRQVTKL
jgi:shikimate kinase